MDSMKLRLDAEKIAIIMANRGMSRKKLSELSGISYDYIGQAMRNKTVTITTAGKIASALDLPVDRILKAEQAEGNKKNEKRDYSPPVNLKDALESDGWKKVWAMDPKWQVNVRMTYGELATICGVIKMARGNPDA